MKFHHAQQGKHPCLVVFLKGLSREENSCTKAPFSAPSRMITRNLDVHRVEDINILIVFHLFIILIRMWSILDFCLFVFLFFLQANDLTTAYWQYLRFKSWYLPWVLASTPKLWANPLLPCSFLMEQARGRWGCAPGLAACSLLTVTGLSGQQDFIQLLTSVHHHTDCFCDLVMILFCIGQEDLTPE